MDASKKHVEQIRKEKGLIRTQGLSGMNRRLRGRDTLLSLSPSGIATKFEKRRQSEEDRAESVPGNLPSAFPFPLPLSPSQLELILSPFHPFRYSFGGAEM